MRLLLVEDNKQLGQLLAKSLRQVGYDAEHLTTVAAARGALKKTSYAALVLDLGLPDGAGWSIIKELKSRQDTMPVLVISGRDVAKKRVLDLRSGTDDFLAKPFAFQELAARLKAMLRRPHSVGSFLRIANLKFDTRNRQVSVDDQPQILSSREATVLEFLMRNRGRVVTKKMVEAEVFGPSHEIASNAIEVYIHRLRRQLLEIGADVRIRTLRGAGYLLTNNNPRQSKDHST
jgi:DNA-binding response OmpR family regulator